MFVGSSRGPGWWAVLGWALSPGLAGAADVSPRTEPPPLSSFQALRVSAPPRIDGVLEEAVWGAAPVFSAFEQSYPQPLAPPSERTEVRLVYDDQNLYVAVTCFDSEPSAIIARLGRRDGIPVSDVVRVMIDSLGDQRTGYMFSLNAGGTLEDARLTGDTEVVTDWDAVWEGAAALDARGWVAEFRLPLHLLRFPDVEEQGWGFHVRRTLARSHEQLDSVSLPRDTNALVSRFRRLRGVRGLKPRRQLTLMPYLAARTSRVPASDDPSQPRPRVVNPSLDVGLDLRATLTSDLSLVATFNPDFGQVEADQLVVNFTTAEILFPEKRPFFLEGLELFSPVDDEAGQTLLYSRRMGLEVPLLGAARLTGTVTRGVEVGLLSALEAGAAAPVRDERVRFHPWRPLHLAPSRTLPSVVPPPTHLFAGVLRGALAPGQTVGVLLTSVNPLRSECVALDDGPCVPPRAGQSAAMDVALRSESGEYTLVGQVDASRVTGLPAEGARLRDGTLMRPGDLGFGAFVRGGKSGGEPFRLDVSYRSTSPRLDLNPAGYQPFQNEQVLTVHPTLFRTTWGPLLSVQLGLKAVGRWSTDERRVGLEQTHALTGSLILPGFHTLTCDLGGTWGRADLREIAEAGLVFERPSYGFIDCQMETNPSRALAATLFSYVDVNNGPSIQLGRLGQGHGADLTWRPLPRLETRLGVAAESYVDGPRWVAPREDGSQLFGEFVPRFLSLSLRQLVVLTPTLTLQAYGQLLSGYGRYGVFFQASPDTRGRISLADLRPVEGGDDPSFHSTLFNLNLVLRWEYAVGSSLFVVYAREQQEPPDFAPERSLFTLLPRGLVEGPLRESLLVKASVAW